MARGLDFVHGTGDVSHAWADAACLHESQVDDVWWEANADRMERRAKSRQGPPQAVRLTG